MAASKDVSHLPLGLLAAAGFLSSAGARVIDPLLAVIAKDFDTTIPMVAILISAFTLPYGLNQILLGAVGERYGKLRVLLAALLGYAVSTAGCALASDLGWLTVLRACAGASSAGLVPICLAYIADAVPYANRQLVVSRFSLGVVLALTMAGPIGGLFGEIIGWRGVFILLAVAALGVAAALAVRLGGLPDRRCDGPVFHLAPYRALVGSRFSVLVLLATLADGMTMAGSIPFLAPFLHAEFALSYATVGLIVASFGLGALIYTQAATFLLPRLGEGGMVTVGGVLMAGSLVAGMLSQGWVIFVGVELLLGLGFFMFHTSLLARATEMLPQARGVAVSGFVAMLFLGQAIGAAVMGGLIGALGFREAFLIDGALIGVLALAVRRLLRSRPVA